MTFEFAGRKFRIGFRHDKSRRWEDHVGHNIIFGRTQKTGFAETTKAGPGVTGPAFVWCLNCSLRLSHLNREQRRRNTACTIWIDDQVLDGQQTWRVLSMGESRLNVAAGDTFDREKGRVAALTNALARCAQPEDTHEFRQALWAWFLDGRKHSVLNRKARGRAA